MSQAVNPQEETVMRGGLTSAEAARRLQQCGPDSVPNKHRPAALNLLSKFWAPVPWMLETTITLQLLLGKQEEALIIVVLLGFNAVLGFLQESQSQNAVALLCQHLSVQTRVLRDGRWGC